QNVEAFIELTANERNIEVSQLKNYQNFIQEKTAEMSKEAHFNWTKNQTYIALSNLLSACASLQIDTCPMEGFDAEHYNKILGLSNKGLHATIVAPIGYRSVEDESQHSKKVRKPLEELFKTL
ncbi:MAG: nitroreductase family protein, partial [Flavicella sp.]